MIIRRLCVAAVLAAAVPCLAAQAPFVELDSPFGKAPLASPFQSGEAKRKATLPTLEIAARKAVAAQAKEQPGPTQVGESRRAEVESMPEEARNFSWVKEGDRQVARMNVRSPGARALRVAIEIARDAALDVVVSNAEGWSRGEGMRAPMESAVAGPAGLALWTPVTSGEEQVIELSMPASARAPLVRVSDVSHLTLDPMAGEQAQPKLLTCQQNYACSADTNILNAGKAVARLVITVGGNSYLCSGALLNDRASTGTPWFATAGHCGITTQAVASSLQLMWFYEQACSATSLGAFSTTIGTQMLYTDYDNDFTLLRVTGPMPSGLAALGWDNTALTEGDTVFGVHHPAGSAKKYSTGTFTGNPVVSFRIDPDLPPLRLPSNSVNWTLGNTEGGSSGSPLITGTGQFRGALTGGPLIPTCGLSRPSYYSRFAFIYQEAKAWLDPGTANVDDYADGPGATLTSQPVALDTTKLQGVINSATDEDWFRFTFPLRGVWMLYTTDYHGSTTNTFGQILDATGGIVLARRTGANLLPDGRNSIFLTQVGQNSTYFFRATGFNQSTGPYIVNSVYFPDDDHSDLPFLGTPLAPNGAITGGLSRPGDADYFIIDIPTAGRFTVASDGFTDTAGYLYNQNFDLVALNDDASFPSNLNFRIDRQLGPGRYYLGVTGFDVSTLGSYLLTTTFTAGASSTSYQGLWLRTPFEQESGWGLNLTHQGDNLFATWFTYDDDGSGMWLVMSAGVKTGENTYNGALYRTTGPAFNSVPFTSIGPSNYTLVGSLTLNFTDADNGSMTYTYNAVTQTKPIRRFIFASPAPTCAIGGSSGTATNFSDLWWKSGTEESGWGVNLTHQGDVLFATWFTYDTNGKGMWLVMSNGAKTGSNTFSGALQRTTGPSLLASPWNPALVTRQTVGNATFTFTDPNNGTFAYTVNGISQTKPITRLLLSTPATVCR